MNRQSHSRAAVYAADIKIRESDLLGFTTIYVPAAEPDRVWMIGYPGGRIGEGTAQAWQVSLQGEQLTEPGEVMDFPATRRLVGLLLCVADSEFMSHSMQHQPMTSTHQSLQRAIAIMREFSELEPALTVTEISHRLGLHKSTVSRILATLLEEGMVWHNSETGRYSLGMALVEMAGVALGQIDVRAAAMPHIERLAAETNETITVAVRRGREAITVALLPTTHPIRHVVWIGRRIPLRTTAAGKVLLAAMHSRGEDWRALVGIPEEDRPAEWEATLGADLTAIAARGYAEESDESEIGTSAIAAPVLDHTGAAVAALSISGPSARFGSKARDAAAPLLIETANEVATDLGMRRPAGLAGNRR